HVLQNTQLRAIAILKNCLQAAVVIDISQSERPPILQKIHFNSAGYVGKGAITVVRVKHIALEPAPCAIRANELINRVPAPLVVVSRLGHGRRLRYHLPPEETVEIFS